MGRIPPDSVLHWHKALADLGHSGRELGWPVCFARLSEFLAQRHGVVHVETVGEVTAQCWGSKPARGVVREFFPFDVAGNAGLRVGFRWPGDGQHSELARAASQRVACVVASVLHAGNGRQSRPAVLGASASARSIHRQLTRFAPTRLPMLIIGERGTGKGLIARLAHAVAGGREADFFALNCAAVPETLAESALFGHRRGAFTGAHADRDGVLLTASRRDGALLLDDIAEFPSGIQPKLLNAVEEHTFYPVGGDRPVCLRNGAAPSLRLYATTQPAALHRLRPDLRDRLGTCLVEVAPLRDRLLDVPWIADRRLEGTGKALGPSGWRALLEYDWPGNVRQLHNVLDRAAVLTDRGFEITGDIIRREIESERRLERLAAAPGVPSPPALEPVLPLHEVEQQQVTAALERTGGNVSAAARLLGLKRTTLQSRLRSVRSR